MLPSWMAVLLTVSFRIAVLVVAGDGVWAVPAAILALAKRPPPLCMTFFNSATALRLVKTVKTLT